MKNWYAWIGAGILGISGCASQMEEVSGEDALHRCRAGRCAPTTSTATAGANVGDCGLESIEMALPYVAGSGGPISVTRVNTSDVDLVCQLNIGVTGQFRRAGDGALIDGAGGPQGTSTILAQSSDTYDWNPESLFNDSSPYGMLFIPGNTYHLEACTYSRGPVGAWGSGTTDQNESNRCKTVDFTVIEPSEEANSGDCGLESIEMALPYALGSRGPISVTRVNTTDMDLSCALKIALSGQFRRPGTGALVNGSGGPQLYGTVLANSAHTYDWDPESMFNDSSPYGMAFIPGNTYSLEACTFSYGAVGGWDGFMIDQNESNRCKSLQFTVAN